MRYNMNIGRGAWFSADLCTPMEDIMAKKSKKKSKKKS